jgi:hypothetical protein
MGVTTTNHHTTKVTEAEQELRQHDPDLLAEFETKPNEAASDPTKHLNIGANNNNSNNNANNTNNKEYPYRYIPLTMDENGRTHLVSNEAKALFESNEVTMADLQEMTNFFYDKAFQDVTLDTFIRSHDDPHGDRFAKWIHQKLTGSRVWDEERAQRDTTPITLARGMHHIVHDRSSAHAAAWYSAKRPAVQVGRHFQLDEARVWMRLHFWALRSVGLHHRSPTFCDYYLRFIGHFVRVYENTAPAFARDSWRWSADPANIERYIAQGRVMTDVLGLSVEEAEAHLPEAEANDSFWPYHVAENMKGSFQ